MLLLANDKDVPDILRISDITLDEFKLLFLSHENALCIVNEHNKINVGWMLLSRHNIVDGPKPIFMDMNIEAWGGNLADILGKYIPTISDAIYGTRVSVDIHELDNDNIEACRQLKGIGQLVNHDGEDYIRFSWYSE